MKKTAKRGERLGPTAKVVAMSISSTAAMLSIFTFARAWGLMGDAKASYTVGSFGARWVGVAPAADTARAIGDTIHLAATVTGRNGAALVGATIGWTSSDPTVATVDDQGDVIARGRGDATIVATVGKLSARAKIAVRQVVAAVRIAGDTAIVLTEGDRQLIPARAEDARGHPVRVGRIAWSSSDTGVVAIDSLSHVTAVHPGRATLSAVVDGVTAYAPVTVLAVPASVTLVAGAEQRAAAGSALPQPIVVRVLDRRGEPIPSLPVRFRAGEADGTAESAIAFTDASGRARTGWTLGDLPGRQRMFATVDRLDSALLVVADAEPTPRNTVATPVNDRQSARVKEELPHPVAIRLSDSTGRALVDVPVTWTVLDGGSITPVDERTDSLGEARATWKLGPKAGEQRTRIQIGRGRTVPPAHVTAIAHPGEAASLATVSGDGQRGAAGARLAKPVVVRVLDVGGNAVPNVSVVFSANDGTSVDSSLVSDSAGTVAYPWTLGRKAGPHTLAVRVDGVAKTLSLKATARASEPANIGFATTVADGIAGRTLDEPVTITVTDVFGNPVANAPVSFSTRAGSVSPARAVTDERGRARTRWTLGTAAGEQELVAAVRGTDVRSSLTVIGKAPPPTSNKAPAKKPASSPSSTRRPRG